MTGRENPPALWALDEAEGSTSPAVGVVVLTYEGRELVERCLESVLRSTYPSFRVVVVDNGSQDGTPEFVARQFPSVQLVRYHENLGFSSAYNEAIREANEPYVVLLNQDAEVATPDWIERLVEVAEAWQDCAVVACKILFREAPHRVNSLGAMAYWWTTAVDIGLGEEDRGRSPEGFEPFSGSGGAMLVRRDLFLRVGGFDETFFMYCEDFDLSWRLRLAGYRVLIAPEAVVLHDFSAGLGRLSPKKVYLVHRNFTRAMLKNYGKVSLLRGLPQQLLYTAVKASGLLLARGGGALFWAPWRALAWNARVLRDTLHHRREIQRLRTIDDQAILRAMGPSGFEPLRSMRRRLSVAQGEERGS